MSTQTQDQNGNWVKAKPLPFSYGVLTKGYWRNFFRLLGEAIRGEERV